MQERSLNSILERLAGLGPVTLAFSRGKDSRACAVLLRDAGIDYTPIYFYHHPPLQFVDDDIRYCEDYLQKHIVQLPHPVLSDYLRHQSWQGLTGVRHLLRYDLPKRTFAFHITQYLESVGRESGLWDVVGLKRCDSYNRQLMLRKVGPFDEAKRRCYPLIDIGHRNVDALLRGAGFALPPDYEAWGRSFDMLSYNFTVGMQRHFPKDWQRMLEFMPLLEVENVRYEAFH